MDWSVIRDRVDEEIGYQDSKFKGNDGKPLEVWLLVASGYMNDAMNTYAHGTQEQVKNIIVKVVACLVRGLMAERR